MVARVGVQTEAVGGLEIFQEVIVELQVAIEALLLILVLVVLDDVVGVGHTVGGVVVTRGAERVVQVFHLDDGDVTRRLHDAVVHRARLLTSGHEVVALEGVVQRGAERDRTLAVAAAARHGVLGVGVGVARDDTVIVDLRQRHKVGALVGGTVERDAVAVTETGAEEVLHVALDGQVRLQALAVVVGPAPQLLRAVEAGTP